GMRRAFLCNTIAPDAPPTQVRAIAPTPRGKRPRELLRVGPRRDGRGNPYYWIAYERAPAHAERDGTDLSALADNRISVTPLRLNMTDEPFMTRLAEILG